MYIVFHDNILIFLQIHFNEIFAGIDTINRQAVLCHRVLRTLQRIARGPITLERETWESLLLFLIGINDALLAPPAIREDAGEQLCERVLGVLLEVNENNFYTIVH